MSIEHIKQIYQNYAPEDVKSLPQRTECFQKKKNPKLNRLVMEIERGKRDDNELNAQC